MSAQDSSGAALAPGDKVVTTKEIQIPNKGSIPSGTSLTVKAFGRNPNHVDVEFGGKVWFLDGATLKKG